MTDDAPLPLAPPDPPTPVLGWVLLATITGLALYLRLPYLNESLWLDELHTSWTIIDGWGPIYERAAIGNYSPAYFWLVRMVTEVAGHHEWSLRLLSLLAGTALVPAVGALTWRWTGALAPGLLAAWLAAIDEAGILFSVEARPYALIALLATLHVWLTAELAQSHSLGRRAAWILVGVILVYLHYTAALLLVAEAAWYFILFLWRRMWPPYGIYYALIDGGILLVACIPAWIHLLGIGGHRDEWMAVIERPGVGDLLSLLPVGRDLLLPAGIAVGWWLLSAWLANSPLPSELGATPAWLPLAVTWLCVPLLIAWALAANDVARLYLIRYLFFATPALFVLGAILLLRVPPGWPRVVFGAIVVLVSLIVSPVFPWEQVSGPLVRSIKYGTIVLHQTENWRWALSIAGRTRPQPLIVEPGLIERERLKGDPTPLAQEYLTFPVRALYSPGSGPIFPLFAGDEQDPQYPAFRKAIENAGGAIILMRVDWKQREAVAQSLVQYWKERGLPLRIRDIAPPEGLAVVWLTLESDDAAASGAALPPPLREVDLRTLRRLLAPPPPKGSLDLESIRRLTDPPGWDLLPPSRGL